MEDIYKVHQLTSMKAMRRVWDEMPASILNNCWHHAGLLVGTKELGGVEDGSVAGILVAMGELVVSRT